MSVLKKSSLTGKVIETMDWNASWGTINYHGFLHSNRWLDGVSKDPQSIRDFCATVSKTKLKKMLYSLINRRDKMLKKGTISLVYTMKLNGNPNEQPQVNDELDLINKAILLVTDEIAHRSFANMLGETEPKDNGKKE